MAEQVTKTIIVKGDISNIYQLWANFENFPHFMKNVKEVKPLDEKTSEWTVTGPVGTKVRWTAEITRMEPNKRIAWNSKDHKGTVTTSGQVTFNNLSKNETEVTVLMKYSAPGGQAGKVATRLLVDPAKRLEEDLRNFKSFAEGMYDRAKLSG